MYVRRNLKAVTEIFQSFLSQPTLAVRLLRDLPTTLRGIHYSQSWKSAEAGQIEPHGDADTTDNPLREFFKARETGRGIWKWDHYFDVYHRHFSRFIGQDAHVLEIGVYSGGSLEMWRDYFGPGSHIYGVDIAPECKAYENEQTKIFIGDQADRSFWKEVKQSVPDLDILIDDGGHSTEQQIATLEEMLPHLRPGGIFLCEDVAGVYNGFSAYMQGLISNLNDTGPDPGEFKSSGFQEWIRAIHFYPYVTVIEKSERPVKQFIDGRRGTEWQPW